jgi:hypothetical protein
MSRRNHPPEAASPLARNLEAELPWFCRVLEARLKLHFGQESPVRSIDAIPPPRLDDQGCLYAALVRDQKLSPHERLVVALGLAPFLRPALLDPLFTRNSTYDRNFTEFGGLPSAQGGFNPSVETALFLLAGDDLGARLAAQRFFAPDHPLLRAGILDTAAADTALPPAQRALRPTPALLHQLFYGEPWRPRFGSSFPARRITSPLDWGDLVLPHATRARIDEIVAWTTHGRTLLDDWGLGRHLKPGFRALFAGPPGTGKTLTATLLGHRTGLDVYRIDLALVVSKYIGETEKNLEAVFSQAEDQDWILFFDEADALFGKRTQVRDAHDRYANQEISYLLQRLEDFPGLVILATNLKDNLDEAFLRRFQAVNYRLSGGAIMNVVRHCSLQAVQRPQPRVELADILEGIRREYHKEGRTL